MRSGVLDDHLLKHLRPLVSLNWLSQQTVSDSGFSGLPDIGEPGPYYMGDYSGGVFSTLIQPADGLEKCTGDLYGPFNYLRSEETGRAHAFRSWRDANGPIVIVFTGIDLAFSLFHLRHRAEALLDKRWVPEERLRMVHPDVYRERCLAFVREVRESSQANGESRPIWLTGYGPAGMLAQQLGLELSDWVGETPEPGLRVISFNSPGLDVAPEGRQDHITSIVTDKWLFHVTGRHHPGACYYWGTAHGYKLGGSHLIGAYGIETPVIDGSSGRFLAGGDLQNLFELMSMLDLWLLLGHDAFVEAFAGYTLGELMAIAKGELTVEGGELGDQVRRDWPIYCDRLWHDPWYHGLGSLLEDAVKRGARFRSWESHLERLPNSGAPALTEGVPLVEEEVGPPGAEKAGAADGGASDCTEGCEAPTGGSDQENLDWNSVQEAYVNACDAYNRDGRQERMLDPLKEMISVLEHARCGDYERSWLAHTLMEQQILWGHKAFSSEVGVMSEVARLQFRALALASMQVIQGSGKKWSSAGSDTGSAGGSDGGSDASGAGRTRFVMQASQLRDIGEAIEQLGSYMTIEDNPAKVSVSFNYHCFEQALRVIRQNSGESAEVAAEFAGALVDIIADYNPGSMLQAVQRCIALKTRSWFASCYGIWLLRAGVLEGAVALPRLQSFLGELHSRIPWQTAYASLELLKEAILLAEVEQRVDDMLLLVDSSDKHNPGFAYYTCYRREEEEGPIDYAKRSHHHLFGLEVRSVAVFWLLDLYRRTTPGSELHECCLSQLAVVYRQEEAFREAGQLSLAEPWWSACHGDQTIMEEVSRTPKRGAPRQAVAVGQPELVQVVVPPAASISAPPPTALSVPATRGEVRQDSGDTDASDVSIRVQSERLVGEADQNGDRPGSPVATTKPLSPNRADCFFGDGRGARLIQLCYIGPYEEYRQFLSDAGNSAWLQDELTKPGGRLAEWLLESAAEGMCYPVFKRVLSTLGERWSVVRITAIRDRLLKGFVRSAAVTRLVNGIETFQEWVEFYRRPECQLTLSGGSWPRNFDELPTTAGDVYFRACGGDFRLEHNGEGCVLEANKSWPWKMQVTRQGETRLHNRVSIGLGWLGSERSYTGLLLCTEMVRQIVDRWAEVIVRDIDQLAVPEGSTCGCARIRA